MARKTRRAALPAGAGGFPVTTLIMVGVIGAALGLGLGAGGTYLFLRPALKQASAAQALTADAALALGNTAFDSKQWSAAVSYYTQAIAAGADTPNIRTDLGTAYRSLRQPQKALEQFAQAQKEDPKHEESLLNQGIVYAFDLGDTARAVSLWQQYLQRFPNGKYRADVQKFIVQVQAHPPAAPAPAAP